MINTLPSVVHQFLTAARYEVLPTDRILEQVLEHVPADVTLAVTASPTKGLGATLDLVDQLAEAGYDVVPHLAARMVSGRAELAEIVERLRGRGVSKVFVPAGDAAEPAGDYVQSLDLLRDLTELGSPFAQVSITGYPEPHPLIDDDVTVQSMWDKRQHATHIVSNLTFDTAAVAAWLRRVRRRGIDLPVLVGVPGPVERTQLLGMATKVGVGDSLRFLRKQTGVLARIAAPGFSTDTFVARTARLVEKEDLGVSGLHIYTFNQVAVVEAWRQAQLAGSAARS